MLVVAIWNSCSDVYDSVQQNCITKFCTRTRLPVMSVVFVVLAYNRAYTLPDSAHKLAKLSLILSVIGIVFGIVSGIILYVLVYFVVYPA